MFISNAYAQAPAAGAEGFFSTSMMLMLGVMFIAMYFLSIRPQQKAAKERQSMIDALAKGDEVVTAGGILGKVNKIADAYIVLEISNGNEMTVQKNSITTLLPKGTLKSV